MNEAAAYIASRQASPRPARRRAFTVDTGSAARPMLHSDGRLPYVHSPRNSLPDVMPIKQLLGRTRSDTTGTEVPVPRYRTGSDASTRTSENSITAREVWAEEATSVGPEPEPTAHELEPEQTSEAEPAPEEIIEKLRYTRYLRLGPKESEDDGLPRHLAPKCLIVGHTKVPFLGPSNGRKGENSDVAFAYELDKQDKPDEEEEQDEQELENDEN